jgi:hypothetical protein
MLTTSWFNMARTCMVMELRRKGILSIIAILYSRVEEKVGLSFSIYL